MKITNKYNMPRWREKALAGWTPKPNRISVTDLIHAPQQRMLKILHWDKLTKDVVDCGALLIGIAMADLGEKWSETGFAEHVLRHEFSGITVSGRIDDYENYIVEDGKTCKAYAIIFGQPDWGAQLNIYAHMMRLEGREVKGVNIIADIKDWNRIEALRNRDYPRESMMVVPQKLWDNDEAERYILNRISMHKKAIRGYADVPELFECTPEEMFASPDKWAVYKNYDPKKKQRALRVFEHIVHAENLCKEKLDKKDGHKYNVIYRQGENKKCENYCDVSNVCIQFKKLKGGK